MKAYLRFGWGEPCVVGAPWTAIDRWRGSQYCRTRVHSIPRRSRSEAVIIIAQSPALAIIFTFMVDSTFWFACLRDNVRTSVFMNDKNTKIFFDVLMQQLPWVRGVTRWSTNARDTAMCQPPIVIYPGRYPAGWRCARLYIAWLHVRYP